MSFSQRVLWKRSEGARGHQDLVGAGVGRGHQDLVGAGVGRGLVVAAFLGLTASPVRADFANYSLRLSAFEESKDVADEKPVYPASLWVTVRPDLPADFHVYVEAVERLPGGDKKATGELREAYVERSFGIVDAKVGRQIIVWGRADKLNPTDQLTTKDLQRLSSDDEEQRLGLGAAQLALNIGDYRLIGVWQYEWQNPVFPAFAANPGVRLVQVEPNDPAQQFALKLDHSGGQVDWSLSGFRGYNRTPDLAVTDVVQLQHHRITVVGGDVAFNAADIGWRAEIAHTQTVNGDGTDPLMQRDFTSTVVGGDKNLIENLNLNMQYFIRLVDPDHSRPDPLQSLLQKQLQINAQQRHEYQDGLTLRVNYKALQETLECETAFVWNRQDDDRTLRPKVTYAWTDQLKSIIGAELYYGARDTFFGQLQDFSGAYAELRYSF